MSFMPVVLWSDALVFLLLAAGIAGAWYTRQREHLLLPWRRVAQSAQNASVPVSGCSTRLRRRF